MRLIDADALRASLNEKSLSEKFRKNCNPEDVIYAILVILDKQPTAYSPENVSRNIRNLVSPFFKEDDREILFKGIDGIIKNGLVDFDEPKAVPAKVVSVISLVERK